jgi:hypothetical protein
MGAGDGTFLLLFAALEALVTLRRALVDSDIPILRWAPPTIAIAMASELAIAFQQTGFQIDDWVRTGGHGERTTALYALVAGVVAVAIGVAVVTIRDRPWVRRRPGD